MAVPCQASSSWNGRLNSVPMRARTCFLLPCVLVVSVLSALAANTASRWWATPAFVGTTGRLPVHGLHTARLSSEFLAPRGEALLRNMASANAVRAAATSTAEATMTQEVTERGDFTVKDNIILRLHAAREEGQLLTIRSEEEFDALLEYNAAERKKASTRREDSPADAEDEEGGRGVMVVDYSAPWCRACKKLLWHIKKLVIGEVAELRSVIYAMVDGDVGKALCKAHGIERFPTLEVYLGNNRFDRWTGNNRKRFEENLREAVAENRRPVPQLVGVGA
eukprot:TRINITY_DN74737_c0_g1_i1.p1 TRINITY_DN74737_c0_g1~~TRINITY_DN74737_c0_g1_i1.p1  ORF type:complete len:280 (+),score=58.74 TRINITY_DN74737_c0_g1_i1:206-1045(+)